MPPAFVAITGIPLCKASETLTSKPSRKESCNTIFAFDMIELSTIVKSTGQEITLITRRESHDHNVRGVRSILVLLQHIHDLIINNRRIGIINGTMSNNRQLRLLGPGDLLVENVSRFDEGADDVWDSL